MKDTAASRCCSWLEDTSASPTLVSQRRLDLLADPRWWLGSEDQPLDLLVSTHVRRRPYTQHLVFGGCGVVVLIVLKPTSLWMRHGPPPVLVAAPTVVAQWSGVAHFAGYS